MGADENQSRGPLAIIGCGGSLPFAVADAVAARGRQAMLFAVEGVAEGARVGNYQHRWVKLGQGGRLMSMMRDAGCRDVVFIGSLTRPPLSKIRLDIGMLMMLPTIISSFRGGDDHLLKNLGRILETNGFRLVGAHDVAPEITVPKGNLTKLAPSATELADIERGLGVLKAMGPFDVGQAVVVTNGHVIAIEGIEGTDEMLARVADLRRRGRLHAPEGRGVIVKAPKPEQDRRFDLPAIGPKTVDGVTAAGLAGIAVAAGETIMAEPMATVTAADQAGIFVFGIEASAQ
jgi:DUF1009 family protein